MKANDPASPVTAPPRFFTRHPTLAVFLIALACYSLTAGGHLYSPDEEVMFRMTRALATAQGIAVEPFGPGGFATAPGNPPRADGLEYAQYGIGQPLLAVPLYWKGMLLSRVLGADFWERATGLPVGAEVPAGEAAARFALSWFNILAGAILAALVFQLCLLVTGHTRASLWAALLYALGSLAWPHSRPFFTETLATLMIVAAWVGLLLAIRRPHRMYGWCAVAGAAAGYAALVRMDSVLAYPGLAMLLLIPIVRTARAEGCSYLAAWVAFCLPALVCGGVILGLNVHMYGSVLASGYADQEKGIAFTTPVLQGLYGLLFSAGKGMFFFSPALVLSFLGWGALGNRRPGGEAKLSSGENLPALPGLLPALLLGILVPLIIHAKWQNWSGGWCWGPRHIFIIHPLLAVPIAAWLAVAWEQGVSALRASTVRITAVVTLAIGMFVQLLGSSQDFIDFHRLFFQNPGSPTAFYVTYDEYDMQFWSRYYQLYFQPAPQAEPIAVPLYPPAPLQDVLYVPQRTVWRGYPMMLQAGYLDNVWWRLIRGPESAGAAAGS